ncbi:serine hydrolase domain-containing protein [Streptomyces sp. NPDC059009]|uniref:serine hydrolase domain-containing protein n=1 Tax=Streptomyces sp. NPDC059009 TaxID=3346694 RepID=UPI00369C7874
MSKNVTWDEEGNWEAKGSWGTKDSAGHGIYLDRWQARLDKLRKAHHVPGAALAIVKGGEIYELASGVLNVETEVEVTTDSVFQIGSIAKIYTATMVLRLVDAGQLDLDARVVDVLPEFATPDPEATAVITVRQLLSHTGGVTNDFTYDSGRGDDCLEKYVEAAREVALDCPPGSAVSYGGLGYIVLGRIIEVITGKTWDEALQELLAEPLGLTHTVTLPEQALRFRAAMSHLGDPGKTPDPAPAWDLMPRSAGPYGRVIASAADVARLALMHLNNGTASGGGSVLSPQSVAAMQHREVDVPDKWTVSSDGWGLGWTLYNWHGVPGFGHDGASIGQYGYLRVVPEAGVALVLLTNGGSARPLYAELFRELLSELAGVTMPEPFGPSDKPVAVDMSRYVGTYKREGVVITVSEQDGKARLLYEFVDGMKDMSPPLDMEMLPVEENVFAASGAGPSFAEDYMPVVFSTMVDGTKCCYIGMRCAPKVG